MTRLEPSKGGPEPLGRIVFTGVLLGTLGLEAAGKAIVPENGLIALAPAAIAYWRGLRGEEAGLVIIVLVSLLADTLYATGWGVHAAQWLTVALMMDLTRPGVRSGSFAAAWTMAALAFAAGGVAYWLASMAALRSGLDSEPVLIQAGMTALFYPFLYRALAGLDMRVRAPR
jgi:cell shape-determining protein MreD